MLIHYFLHTDLSNKILKFGTPYVEQPLHSSHVCTCNVLSMPTRDLRHFMHCYLFTVSIYIGATSVGCLLSGIMMDMWGRKLAVQISISSVCIGWLLIAISTTYPLMLVGRALCGFGKGFATPAVTVSYKFCKC